MNLSKDLIKKLLLESPSFLEYAVSLLVEKLIPANKKRRFFCHYENEIFNVFEKQGKVAAIKYLSDCTAMQEDMRKYFITKYELCDHFELLGNGRLSLGFAKFIVEDYCK
jgi:hypothetical protein